MTNSTRRTALITGASSGIGEAFADVFASEGFDLVIVARREERLQAVAARIRQQYGVHVETVIVDLGQRESIAALCRELDARGLTIDALVNNAGYGVPGAFTTPSWDRQAEALQVMLVGVADLTYRLLPGMVSREYGRIINVASLAGLVPAPAGHTLYGATKAFLIKFSEALSHEVRKHGVHVTAICPGFTRSEFHDVTGTRAGVNKLPAWMWMEAPTVARQGFDAVTQGIPIYVNGRVNRTIALLVRYMPQWLVLAVGRMIGKKNRKTS